MKVWLIRGRYNRQHLANNPNFWEYYGEEYDKKYTDGQWLYWTRNSNFDKKEVASIQANKPSADRALKRAKKLFVSETEAKIIGIELVEAELIIPQGE